MEAFCCHGNQSLDPICPKTLCSLSPTPVMLHIKFDQDWPTGFRDIQVWKCGRRTTTTDDDDGRRTDDGPLVYYKLTLWAFGSGELKIGHLASMDGCICAFEETSLRRMKSAIISGDGSNLNEIHEWRAYTVIYPTFLSTLSSSSLSANFGTSSAFCYNNNHLNSYLQKQDLSWKNLVFLDFLFHLNDATVSKKKICPICFFFSPSIYRKFPKFSDIGKIGWNPFKICPKRLNHSVIHPNGEDRMANSVDPNQTAPLGAVWSGSALFAQTCTSKNVWSLR